MRHPADLRSLDSAIAVRFQTAEIVMQEPLHHPTTIRLFRSRSFFPRVWKTWTNRLLILTGRNPGLAEVGSGAIHPDLLTIRSGRRSERYPLLAQIRTCLHNDPELMTSVIGFALSSHAMLTAIVRKIDGCEAHVFGKFDRLVRSGTVELSIRLCAD
jgi:hypothetical protein